jgi:hypothetical protein
MKKRYDKIMASVPSLVISLANAGFTPMEIAVLCVFAGVTLMRTYDVPESIIIDLVKTIIEDWDEKTK